MKLAVIGSTGLVGSQLVALAESRGHAVTGISKESGVDLLVGTGLDKALDGVEAVINVIQSPNLEQQDSTEFFTTVAAKLGRAAAGAGVRRTVVLSIIGVDRVAAADSDTGTGYDGYYAAKFAQEQATREHTPGAHVVRSAQFHDIARQMLSWGRTGDTTTVPDLLIQPLAVAAMVEVPLDVATGARDGDLVEVAGPGPSISRRCRPRSPATKETPCRSSLARPAARSATESCCPIPTPFSSARPSTSGWRPSRAPERRGRAISSMQATARLDAPRSGFQFQGQAGFSNPKQMGFISEKRRHHVRDSDAGRE